MPKAPTVKVVQQSPKPTAKTAVKKAKNILDDLIPVSEVSSGLTFSLYGRSGTGKTSLAATFPAPGIIIGAEDGTKSVQDVPGYKFFPLWDPETLVTDSSRLVQLYEAVDWTQTKSVHLDTASSLQDILLREVLGLETIPVQKTWGMATRETWGTVGIRMKEMLRLLLDLKGYGINVVIIAQERNFKEEGDSEILSPTVGSALSPSVASWLNANCDYIGQTFIRDQTEVQTVKMNGVETKINQKTGRKEYCLRTGVDSVYTTRFRRPRSLGPMPEVLVDPSYKKIMKLLKGEK